MSSTQNENSESSSLYDLINFTSISVRRAAFEYIRRHFMEVAKNDKILFLNIETFLELIRSDDLNVTSEIIVFEMAKKWLIHNNVEPQVGLDLFMEVIRLPLLPREYLLTEVLPYTYSIEKCRPFILEALRWHMYPNERSELSTSRTIPRKVYSRILSVGSGFYETGKIIEMYDAATNKWTQLKDLNIDKRNIAAAMVDRNLMIIGGYKNEKSQKSVETVDLLTGNVTSISPMQQERHNVGVAVIGEGKSSVLYVIGGLGVTKALRTVERWDLVNRQWSFVTPMITARNNPGVAVLNNNIYAAGGNNGPYTEFYKSLEMFNIKADRWEIKASMVQQRSICRMTAAGNFLYAIGGRSLSDINSALSNVERYDPKNDTWTFMASISSSGILGVISLGKYPVYVGGDTVNLMEIYDPEKNKWNRLTPPNIARDRHNLVQLPIEMIDYKFDW